MPRTAAEPLSGVFALWFGGDEFRICRERQIEYAGVQPQVPRKDFMRGPRIPGCILKVVCAVALVACSPIGSESQSIGASDADAHSVPIYVNDFELPAAGAQPAPPKGAGAAGPPAKQAGTNTAPANAAPAKSPDVLLESDTPNAQARRLTDFFAMTLVEMFGKNGYTAKRRQGPPPDSGVLVRGVFTEIDPTNRVHKAILGGLAPGTKYMLYVGIFNLARPNQPLYQLALDEAPDERFGPLITLNNYVPMAKYELDKHPTEEDVRKICEQIVSSLTQLLEANPAAFAEK
jgi:hypothetical protein